MRIIKIELRTNTDKRENTKKRKNYNMKSDKRIYIQVGMMKIIQYKRRAHKHKKDNRKM